MPITISLPDGSVRNYDQRVTPGQVAAEIGRGLAKVALAAKVNGEVVDLDRPLGADAKIEILTFDSPEGREVFRHTSSHIMAQAVKRLYPDAKLAIGPSIIDGYYYDFDVPHPFTPEDLEKIEAEMRRIVQEDLSLERMEISRDEAVSLFEGQGEKYKVELIRDLPEDVTISLYKQGDFVDLCAGPHLPSTGRVKAVKLMSLAGAYWRGNEKNAMLQRIYGTSFQKQRELEEHLFRLEEAKKRDHRKLGKELDLFSVLDEGPGFPFFHPKGMIIRNLLEDFWRQEHRQAGYQEIKTPMILNEELWHRSGHWNHYKENMYFTKIDEVEYAVKPMNCPGSMLVYKRRMWSYRDFPFRMGELGLVHRHELSGALHGLLRVRCFTQDDAHIFMLPPQIQSEVRGVIELADKFYKRFGFDYHIELSTRPENSMGSDQAWETATRALEEALKSAGKEYKVNPGDGAFYGPKIDFHLKDSIGRTWQCGTIQLDFQMPERFELEYVGEDGARHRPVMVHRVIYGSIERFMALLTEHFAGAFPVWLAPVQVRILPITDRHHDYARQLLGQLEAGGIRAELDGRNEKVNYKIREAQLEKIPYMLVVGDKEAAAGSVAVRTREGGDQGARPLGDFLAHLQREIETQALPHGVGPGDVH